MNTIEKIDIKYTGELGYTINFHFNQGDKSFVKTVLSNFENQVQMEKFHANSDRWRSQISHWTFGVDKVISEDLGKNIEDHILVTAQDEKVGLFDFVKYISNLD